MAEIVAPQVMQWAGAYSYRQKDLELHLLLGVKDVEDALLDRIPGDGVERGQGALHVSLYRTECLVVGPITSSCSTTAMAHCRSPADREAACVRHAVVPGIAAANPLV